MKFQSTPSARRATPPGQVQQIRHVDFNPRPPRGGRPQISFADSIELVISIHALREEGDGSKARQSLCHRYFNPRPPRGGRPQQSVPRQKKTGFQSTPSARRATEALRAQVTNSKISIHALREEGDDTALSPPASPMIFQSTPSARRATRVSLHKGKQKDTISIHALREEGDAALKLPGHRCCLFQSTPSARRATGWSKSSWPLPINFNPRPPRGGRPSAKLYWDFLFCISIHALREEGDFRLSFRWSMLAKFQSTPSARRATVSPCAAWASHARFQSTPSARRATFIRWALSRRSFYFNPRPPRGGRRQNHCCHPDRPCYFNPRPPRGGRHLRPVRRYLEYQFQSTPSARRATFCLINQLILSLISIHALREEGDQPVPVLLHGRVDFNPRPPRGGRHPPTVEGVTIEWISIHALREEGDILSAMCHNPPLLFQSTPSARRATPEPQHYCRHQLYFNPRPPRGGRPARPPPLRPTP